MNKEIYVVRGKEEENYLQFKERVIGIITQLKKQVNPAGLKFTITETAPPFSFIPFSKKKVAVISVYNPASSAIEFIQRAEGFAGGYNVAEALPVSYEISWSTGEPTPGVCLLTLFSKKRNIPYATFIHRWHEIHTSHSIKIHPLWNYVRNVVDEKLSDESQWFDGIVEEQMRTEAQLLNPFRFWGNPVVILPRMLKELYDTKSFIDYSSMETYMATEYWLKVPSV